MRGGDGVDDASLEWYVEHRLEYLQHRQERLRSELMSETVDSEHFPYDRLREYMENKGRIAELKRLRERSERW